MKWGRTRLSAFIRLGRDALHLDQGSVDAGFPEAFIRMAQVMQNYPVGERSPWPDTVTGSALAWRSDLLSPSSRAPAWTGQEPVGVSAFQDGLTTLVAMAPPLLAR